MRLASRRVQGFIMLQQPEHITTSACQGPTALRAAARATWRSQAEAFQEVAGGGPSSPSFLNSWRGA